MTLRSAAGADAVEGRSVLPGLAVAVLAGVLLALGGALPVVTGANPGFASSPLLVLLALAPVVVALVLWWLRRPAGAAGVIVGLGALAPGSIVLALQFAVDASATGRPALYAPESLASPTPAAGLWALVAGRLAMACAGVLAARSMRGDEPDGSTALLSGSRRLPAAAIFASGLAALGLLMAPFTSSDAYVLARGAFSGTGLILAGGLLLAGALPLAAVLAMGSPSPVFGRGCLAGLGLGVLTWCVPDLIAVWSMSRLGLSAGPVVAAVGAVGLLVLAGARFASSMDEAPADGSLAGSARVPTRRRLESATAVLALASCACAIVGGVTAQVTATGALAVLGGFEQPTRWALVVAGILVGLLGLCLLLPRLGIVVRPAVSVVWVAVALAGTSALGAGVAASQVGGRVQPGPGALWTVLAMVLAVVTACLSVVTGILEREDVASSDTRSGVVALPVAGGVVAAVGFALPVAGSADYAGAGLVVNLGTQSWGLLAGLLGVLGAVLVACYSRPSRAAALLFGAAAVVGLRVAQWPLLGSRIDGLAPGVGWWFALAGAVLLVLAGARFVVTTSKLPATV